MSELDDKLNSILSNPMMMQQIMNLAKSMNQSGELEQERLQSPNPAPTQMMNPSMLNRIGNLMQRGSIDKNQQTLLNALSPYLSRKKIQKLERAMHAAKIAGIASEMIGVRGGKQFPGR